MENWGSMENVMLNDWVHKPTKEIILNMWASTNRSLSIAHTIMGELPKSAVAHVSRKRTKCEPVFLKAIHMDVTPRCAPISLQPIWSTILILEIMKICGRWVSFLTATIAAPFLARWFTFMWSPGEYVLMMPFRTRFAELFLLFYHENNNCKDFLAQQVKSFQNWPIFRPTFDAF